MTITPLLAQQHQSIMHAITIHKTLIWQFKPLPHYKWCEDKKLYNCKTGRVVKKTLNGGCVGYWIAGKWYNINKLKTMVERIKVDACPF